MSIRTMFKFALALALTGALALSGVAVAQDSAGPDDGSSEESSEPDDEASEESSEPDDEASEESSEPDDEASEESSEPDDEHSEGEESDSSDHQVTGARVFGADRLSTAVAISQYEFPGGADEVYLARADNFADAVAAGALKRGPVLLVPSCGDLPQIVADEVTRLRPHRVVALGGPGAVCDDMLNAAIAAAQAVAGSDDDEHDDPIGDDDPRTETVEFFDLAVGEQATIDAAPGGTVVVERTNDGVTLVSASPNDGWTNVPETADPGEVDVRFSDGDTRVDVDVEIEDGTVRARVRVRED